MKMSEFFNENEVKIGEGKDFTTTPPMYYSSLDQAFYSYYQTFRDNRHRCHFMRDVMNRKREVIARNFTDSNDNIVLSLLSFHRFIELFIKDLLRRLNPFLPVKIIEGEDNLLLFLDSKISADNLKSIEYADAMKRLKKAFTYYSPDSPQYTDVLSKYQFINDSEMQSGLEILASFRNRIMHNGNTIPNVLAYEYLTSQIVIPLIAKIIDTDAEVLDDYVPFYFSTTTGINVVDEISKTKFDFADSLDSLKSEDVALKLFRIAHLKELGRAAYSQDPLIRRHESHYEPHYKNPVGRFERLAKSERRHPLFHALHKCLCCGNESLVVYKTEYLSIVKNQQQPTSWFICFNCGYSLTDNIGDPSQFGLSAHRYLL